jgi:alpha-D-xyloside xylohydrolase
MKKIGLLFYFSWLFALFTSVRAQSPSFIKTADGVIVYTDPAYTGTARAVKLEVVSESIIRVVAAPGKEIPSRQSLVTVHPKYAGRNWNVIPGKDGISLTTKTLKAVVNSKNGMVAFFNANGQKIVTENGAMGRTFTPAVFEGKRLYNLLQSFQTSADDNWYGLGQHQDGVYNYKGQQVTFFQNNTEVAIPFLISTKNYGILWDNYSLTKAGDVRPLHPLSALKLYAKNGQEGWLTAAYSNDKTKPADVKIERAEADISMEFLGESQAKLPAEFTPANGVVNWEGSIGSELSGLHQLRFTFGGNLKVWLNGKVVLEHWRKAWNPAPAIVPVTLRKGEKIPFRIEWIPEGTESYISLKWQEPLSPEQLNSFAFSSEAGQAIDYYFVYGQNMDAVIAGYRHLTGKAPIVPKWALGFWQSRERYKTEEEILATVAEFRKRKIPLDNIVLDWSYWREAEWGSQDFDPTRFPNPVGMVDVLHKKYNTNIMISVWPKFYENIPAYNDFQKAGWLYARNVADRQRDWIGKGYVSTFYDAFNPAARKGFWDLIHQKIYTKGFDAWWMDASEPDILSNVSPERRKQQMRTTYLGPAAEYLNAYPLQNAKGIYEGQRSVDSNRRVFLLTRSGFAGSQRYAAAIWSGDIGTTWTDMKVQIAAGVNFSMSGLPYWTMDIGGFVVPRKFEQPTEKDTEEWRELNARWYQYGAFVPLFRAHGQYPFREVFNIAPETHLAYQSIVYYNKLRYRLLPYVYALAGAAYHNNGSIMRGLVMDFAKDTAVLNIADQYLFGPSIMVSPVYNYQQRKRDVYLPKGQGWYDFYTGKYYTGGQKLSTDAPYERMPLFVKEGSIIPFGPELQYTTEKPADTINLYVYTGKNASFTLYDDAGTTYDYERGQFATIPLTYDEKTKLLTIGDQKGSYAGMLTRRIFRVTFLSPDTAKPLDFVTKSNKDVVYEGKRLTIRM